MKPSRNTGKRAHTGSSFASAPYGCSDEEEEAAAELLSLDGDGDEPKRPEKNSPIELRGRDAFLGVGGCASANDEEEEEDEEEEADEADVDDDEDAGSNDADDLPVPAPEPIPMPFFTERCVLRSMSNERTKGTQNRH